MTGSADAVDERAIGENRLFMVDEFKLKQPSSAGCPVSNLVRAALITATIYRSMQGHKGPVLRQDRRASANSGERVMAPA
jgi:hypothetical protein